MTEIPNQPEAVQSPQAHPDQKMPAMTEIKKARNIPIIILSILLAVALGTAGYFAYQYYQVPKQMAEPVVMQPTPLPSPTLDPTEDWETYSNTTHNITFKYSPLWRLIEEKGSLEQGTTYNTKINLQRGEVNITMYFNMDGIGGIGQTYDGNPFVLDGNNLYQYQKTNNYNNTKVVGISNSLNNTLGVFELNSITYSIALKYPINYNETEEAELLNEFNQILFTFKFIETD